MASRPRTPTPSELADTADRLDALAETCELMGDDDTARRCKELASRCRLRAMRALDG